VNPTRLLYFALSTSNCVLATESRETFDRSTQLPQGWQSGVTGQGSAKWEVVPEQSAPSKPNVLRQSGDNLKKTSGFLKCRCGGILVY